MKKENGREAKAVIYKRNSAAITGSFDEASLIIFVTLTMSIFCLCSDMMTEGLVLLLLQRHRAPLPNAPVL